eukprot:TRINITY_DN229_c0_g1_i20.p1 TRINITY_DN229_c0_g1~~TRINITY_DN229_c0_g1_i20.p1  ORF type:complete len:1462 (+),score=412.58 TRINITY_DN229_c0_g1_i20:69-4388(+)
MAGEALAVAQNATLSTDEKLAWFDARGVSVHPLQLERPEACRARVRVVGKAAKEVVFPKSLLGDWVGSVRAAVAAARRGEEFGFRLGPRHDEVLAVLEEAAGSRAGLPLPSQRVQVGRLYEKLEAVVNVVDAASRRAAEVQASFRARSTRPPLVGLVSADMAAAIRSIPHAVGTPEFYHALDERGIPGTARQFSWLKKWTRRWRSKNFGYDFKPQPDTYLSWLATLHWQTDGFARPTTWRLGVHEGAVLDCLRDAFKHNPDLAGLTRCTGNSRYRGTFGIGRFVLLALSLRVQAAMCGREGQVGAFTAAEYSQASRLSTLPLRVPYVAAWSRAPKVWRVTLSRGERIARLDEAGEPGSAQQVRAGHVRNASAQAFWLWLRAVRDCIERVPAGQATRTIGKHEKAVLKVLHRFDAFALLDACGSLRQTRVSAHVNRIGADLYHELLKAMRGRKGRACPQKVAALKSVWCTRVEKATELGMIAKRRFNVQSSDAFRRKKPVELGSEMSVLRLWDVYVRLPFIGAPSDAVLEAFKKHRASPAQLRDFDARGVPCSRAQWLSLINWWKKGDGDDDSERPGLGLKYELGATMRVYLKNVIGYGMGVEKNKRERYFGPAEDAIVDYVTRLGVDTRSLPWCLQDKAWVQSVYETLAEVIATRAVVAEDVVAWQRGVVERHESYSQPRWEYLLVLRMPYVGAPPEALITLVSLNEASKRSRYSVVRELDQGGIACSKQQLRAIWKAIDRGELAKGADTGTVETWRDWAKKMVIRTRPPSEAEAGKHGAAVYHVLKEMGLTTDSVKQLTTEQLERCYGQACAAMEGQGGEVERLPAVRESRAAFVQRFRAVEGYYGKEVRRLPLVGLPTFPQLLYMLRPKALTAEARAQLDAQGMPLGAAQTKAVPKGDHVAQRALQRYCTPEPLEAFREWLEAVAEDATRAEAEQRVYMGAHTEQLQDAVRRAGLTGPEAVRAMDDGRLKELYAKMAAAMGPGARGVPAEVAEARAAFAAGLAVVQERLRAGAKVPETTQLAWSRRLPFVGASAGRWSPKLVETVAFVAHEVSQWSSSRVKGLSWTGTLPLLCVLALEHRGVPGSLEQVRDVLGAVRTGLGRTGPATADRIAEHDVSPATHDAFRAWVRELAGSRGEDAAERAVRYGGRVSGYEEVLGAFPGDVDEWSEEAAAVAYSRMCWVGAGDEAGRSGAAVGPRPGRLDAAWTEAEAAFASGEVSAASLGVPAMPYVGRPVSAEHAAALSSQWGTASGRVAMLVKNGWPGNEAQLARIARALERAADNGAAVLGWEDEGLRMDGAEFRVWLREVCALSRKVQGGGAHPVLRRVHEMGLSECGIKDMDEEALGKVYESLLRVNAVFAPAMYKGRPARASARGKGGDAFGAVDERASPEDWLAALAMAELGVPAAASACVVVDGVPRELSRAVEKRVEALLLPFG